MQLEPINRDIWGNVVEHRNPFSWTATYWRYFRQLATVVGAARAAYIVNRAYSDNVLTPQKKRLRSGETKESDPKRRAATPFRKLKKLTQTNLNAKALVPYTGTPEPAIAPKPKTQNMSMAYYAGKFKRKRSVKKSYSQAQLYEFRGSEQATEYNGTAVVTDANGPVYIGFTNNPVAQTMRAFWAAALKTLLMKIGINVSHQAQLFNGQPATNQGTDLTYSYMVQGENSVNNRGVAIALNATFAQAVDTLVADIAAVVSAITVEIEFQKLFVVGISDHTSVAYDRWMPQLDLKNAWVSYKMTTMVKLQNQTGASASGSSSATDLVDTNPLQGYIHELRGNIIRPAAPVTTTVTAIATYGSTDINTGVITGLWNKDTRYEAITAQTMAKPQKRQFGKASSAFIRIEPGHIKKAATTSKGSMQFNKFYNKIREYHADNQGRFPFFGKSIVFALEKTLESGQGFAIPTLAYSGHHTQCMWVKEVKPKEIMYVQGTN